METGPGIQIIWALAAQEALASNHSEIHEVHYFNSLLKFAELDNSSLRHIVRGDVQNNEQLITAITGEKEQLSKELEKRGIKVPDVSAQLRRRLRKRLGDGSRPYAAGMEIHRSREVKKAFIKAEELGARGNAPVCSSVHLFWAFMELLPELVAATCREMGLSISGKKALEPEIDEKDMVSAPLDTVGKALLMHFSSPLHRHYALVLTGKRDAEEIVGELILHLEKCAGAKAIHRIDANHIASADHAEQSEDVMEMLSGEAPVLYAPSLQILLEKKGLDRFADILHRLNASAGARILMVFENAFYHSVIKKDERLKRLIKVIYVHDRDQGGSEIPYAL